MKNVQIIYTVGDKKITVDTMVYASRKTMIKAANDLMDKIGARKADRIKTFVALTALEPLSASIKIFFNEEDLCVSDIVHETEHAAQFLFRPAYAKISGKYSQHRRNVEELLASFTGDVSEELICNILPIGSKGRRGTCKKA